MGVSSSLRPAHTNGERDLNLTPWFKIPEEGAFRTGQEDAFVSRSEVPDQKEVLT